MISWEYPNEIALKCTPSDPIDDRSILGSGNDLMLLLDLMLLPEQMLIKLYNAINHYQGPMS